ENEACAVRQVRGGSEVLGKYFVELSRYCLTAMDFQPASHISPCAFEFAVGHGDPIVVAGDKRDARILDFSLAHLVGPVVHVDPPFAAIRAAEFPLITRVNPFGLVGLETLPHSILHLLASPGIGP